MLAGPLSGGEGEELSDNVASSMPTVLLAIKSQAQQLIVIQILMYYQPLDV